MNFLRGGVLLALVGCGGDLGSVLPAPGSCNVPSTGTCTDYTGSAWQVPSSGQRACAMVPGGSYTQAVCGSSGRVGTCRVQAGSSSELSVRYYSARFNAQTAPPACAAMGGSYAGG
ncbi:MAG: hypothetical protein HY909_26225 [Deltaproteobacteria bacterium]|nr:hypothetical protein [Deltaproteobacteria bacterium]